MGSVQNGTHFLRLAPGFVAGGRGEDAEGRLTAASLRWAAERTVSGLWRRIRSILRAVSEKECLTFFRHMGYE
jgi:hypothetical protein